MGELGTDVHEGWREGEKDEEEYSDLTSPGPIPIGEAISGPTGLGEIEDDIHDGWSEEE